MSDQPPAAALPHWKTPEDHLPVERFHPGEIIRDELEARGMTVVQLAVALGFPRGYIRHICEGRRPVTDSVAMALGFLWDQDPRFWVRLQRTYDQTP